MNPYTIYYTDNKEVFQNVWDGETLQDAIDIAIDELQYTNQISNKNLTVLTEKTMQLEQNQY
jgi:hypothetical protein